MHSYIVEYSMKPIEPQMRVMAGELEGSDRLYWDFCVDGVRDLEEDGEREELIGRLAELFEGLPIDWDGEDTFTVRDGFDRNVMNMWREKISKECWKLWDGKPIDGSFSQMLKATIDDPLFLKMGPIFYNADCDNYEYSGEFILNLIANREKGNGNAFHIGGVMDYHC